MGDCVYRQDVSVVVDGNLITSRGPGTAFDFGLALVKHLSGSEAYKETAKHMLISV
jgi:putative intracellular protease/amidase